MTGDDAGAVDDQVSVGISRAASLPVATLFDVPNQPLFDQREDGLLALSFVQALETGDPDWPALVPMVRSVLAAMSALQELSDGRWQWFVITGASKRGWTTWLAAATGDPRIVAVAPRMFDNLLAVDQMRKQVVDWDGYSPMLDDYTALGLQEVAAEGGRAGDLAAALDPASHLGFQTPCLIVNGANDPFWCTDASSLYAGRLPSSVAFCCCPDTGHVARLPGFAQGAFGALCQAGATGDAWSPARPKWDGEQWTGLGSAFGWRLWSAHSADRKFATAHWLVTEGVARPAMQNSCFTASFMEVLMPAVGVVGPYSLTSPVVVSPPVS